MPNCWKSLVKAHYISVFLKSCSNKLLYTHMKWALLCENLSLGFSKRSYPNQPAQLLELAGKFKFCL